MKLGHCGAESTSVHQQCMPTQMGHTKKRLMQLQMSGGKGGHLNCFVLIVRAFPRTSCSGCSLGLGYVRTCMIVNTCVYMSVAAALALELSERAHVYTQPQT